MLLSPSLLKGALFIFSARENNWVAIYSTVAIDCHTLHSIGFRLT